MLISIVIPVYNRAEMVKSTLKSIVGQTYRPIQLILVDNNSSDNTLSVLEDFKSRNQSADFVIDVVEEKKQGASIARNTGAKLAKGDWLMFFDSDDTMDSCLVEKYVGKIKKNDCDVVCTRIDTTIGNDKIISFLAKDNFLVNHIFHGCFSTIRYIVKKRFYENINGWNESLSYWDDWELGVRLLLEKPKVAIVDDGIYVHVYAHDDSITGNSYSSKIPEAKKAIFAVETAIKNSDHEEKSRLLNFIRYRRVLLAGLCNKEGRTDLADGLMAEIKTELKGNYKLWLLYNILYKYVSVGGRGSQRFVKVVVKH